VNRSRLQLQQQVQLFIDINKRLPEAHEFGTFGLDPLQSFIEVVESIYLDRIFARLGFDGIELVSRAAIRRELYAFIERYGRPPTIYEFGRGGLRSLKFYIEAMGCGLTLAELLVALGINMKEIRRNNAIADLIEFIEEYKRTPVAPDFGGDQLMSLAQYRQIFPQTSGPMDILKAAGILTDH